jgi:hypothetical protein
MSVRFVFGSGGPFRVSGRLPLSAMKIMKLAVIAVGVHALLTPSPAQADCASPGLAFAPHAGATLPPDPIVYVFMPRWHARDSPKLQVRSGHRELAFEASEVSATDAFVAYRLAIATQGASKIEIGRDLRDSPDAFFEIDPDWVGPNERSVRVLDSKYVEDHWSCSFTDAHFLTLTDAPAYRVQWSEAGDTRVAIFPRDIYDFFLRGDRQADSNVGQIGLGHVSCFGQTASSRLELGSVVITGLWPDDLHAVDVEPNPDDLEPHMVDRVEPGTSPGQMAVEDERTAVTFLLALVAGLLGLLFGAGRMLGRASTRAHP